jgi:uncharacterized protein (TIGR00369 family)
MTLLAPNPSNVCFGCGDANERGMKLTFEQDDARRRIVGKFKMGAEYQGAKGILHGGIIAVLFDEAMGKVCRFRQAHAVTAELTVEYLKPIRVEEEIHVEAYEREQKGRSLFHEGEIRNAAGELLARGRGRFVIVDRVRIEQREPATTGA